MKALNKKNLKTINSKVLEYQVLNMMHRKKIDLGIHTAEGAYGSYCFRSALVVAIELYKEFGIALTSENYIVTELLPNEEEHRDEKNKAYDKWQSIKEKVEV